MKALVVGHSDPAAALTSALKEEGIDADLYAVPRQEPGQAVANLAAALVELERRVAGERPAVAIAVGAGDAPLALAITAAKGGIPLVAWAENPAEPAGALDEAQARILSVLADFDVGAVADGVAVHDAAARIADWARLESSA